MRAHPIVFWFSAGIILLFVVLGAVFSGQMEAAFSFIQDEIIDYFGWFYIVAVAFFLLFVLWLFFSKYGKLKLGKDDDEPEYSYSSWFAMLFSAGMGIGLLFYSVAEPILHFAAPPNAEPETVEAAREAMNLTFFHWGLHAWAIYIVIGAALAYYGYRHDLPLTIRSTLYPLLGRRIHGPLGNIVDILAVCGTMFGVATSLGLGVMQINAGLDYLGIFGVSKVNQIILITVITLMATTSVVLGLNKGIKRLSEFAIIAAVVLVLLVFITGPTVFVISGFIQGTGRYLQNLIGLSFNTDAFVGLDWQKGWTMFYWGWWISWSPFVGMFLARISRGRTIREFIAAVLFLPTLVTFFWMSVFGEAAIGIELFGDGGMIAAVQENVATALFVLLDRLPLAILSSTLAVLAIVAFFVTSSDSGSLVIDIITSGGDEDPPVAQRIFWAVTEGAVAATLLMTGGLLALQTAAVTMALPFCVIMIVICIGLVRSLRAEHIPHYATVRAPEPLPADADEATVREMAETPPAEGDGWRARLDQLVAHSDRVRRRQDSLHDAWQAVEQFLKETARPALEDVRNELRKKGRNARVVTERHSVSLHVTRGEGEEFVFDVRGHAYRPLAVGVVLTGDRRHRAEKDSGAEAVIRAGHGRQYPLREWTREGLIKQLLDEYAMWMNW